MTNVLKATLVFSATIGLSSVAYAHGGGERGQRGERGEKCKPPAEMIQKFDANRDGKLDRTERKQMHEAHKAEMLQKFDTNKDGKLSDDERAALWQSKKSEHFVRMDADGNGIITMEEAEQGCGPLKRFFSKVDANGDGSITKDEFNNAKPPKHDGMGHGRRGFKNHR